MPSLWAFYWCWKKFHPTIWSLWTHWTGGTGQYTSRELHNKHHLYTKSLLQNREFSKSSLGLNPLWGQNIQKFSLPKNSLHHSELMVGKKILISQGWVCDISGVTITLYHGSSNSLWVRAEKWGSPLLEGWRNISNSSISNMKMSNSWWNFLIKITLKYFEWLKFRFWPSVYIEWFWLVNFFLVV